MKINDKILSLPPYISTSWDQVSAIRMKGNHLSVTLKGGDSIDIPTLMPEVVEKVFKAHADYLELETQLNYNKSKENSSLNKQLLAQTIFNQDNGELPFRFGFSGIEGMSAALQHNPQQSDAPDIPEPILRKISAIAKIVGPEEASTLPEAEPNCNCVYCQLARAISGKIAETTKQIDEENQDEIVSQDDLKFQQWDIVPSGEKLFTVTNRLDSHEKYNVYLGSPVGCTCGHQSCEHIVAVLKS